MPRAIWKGAIGFGLVHVPVAVYPASQETEVDFDWVDRRTLDPVGYKRINKRTGREIQRKDIARGVKHGSGEYVLLDDDEIKAAYPKTTQTIEIDGFVRAGEVPFPYLEKPYYLAPLPKSEKVYALLREAMLEQEVVGIARVVMHTKEHLAALIPVGAVLMMNTLRWADEVRSTSGLDLPAAGRSAAKLKPAELKMATQLIGQLTEEWKPERYREKFSDAIRRLVEKRAKAGKTATVEPVEAPPGEAAASNVVDLTELLRSSLGERKTRSARGARRSAPRRHTAKSARRKRA